MVGPLRLHELAKCPKTAEPKGMVLGNTSSRRWSGRLVVIQIDEVDEHDIFRAVRRAARFVVPDPLLFSGWSSSYPQSRSIERLAIEFQS